jgi:hypothetical protein
MLGSRTLDHSCDACAGVSPVRCIVRSSCDVITSRELTAGACRYGLVLSWTGGGIARSGGATREEEMTPLFVLYGIVKMMVVRELLGGSSGRWPVTQ